MKLTLILIAAIAIAGCTAKSQTVIKDADQQQVAIGIAPCDTDADCEAKNPEKSALSPCISDGQERGVDCTDSIIRKDGTVVYYCEAITAKGTRCTRHVNENGLLCRQHSKMQTAGKTVKTIE